MARPSHSRQERIIEAVRRGLEGDTAIEFIQRSGYPMTSAGIARHLRKFGGRGRILELISEGRTNEEILSLCGDQQEALPASPLTSAQPELFERKHVGLGVAPSEAEFFPTKKMTIQMPADLYEAIRLAARAEGKNQNQIIVELLTSALSRLPVQGEFEDASG